MHPVREMQMERENAINANVFIEGVMQRLRVVERWSLTVFMLDP